MGRNRRVDGSAVLNDALLEKRRRTQVPKLFAVVVLAFPADHLISPLALREETIQNALGSEAWATPRFGLARRCW